ncbi:hypothetical protein [Neochlamydia sp. S13]|uniref:hypothetical protein n=1 Tax=Neochlamydia sp. S13 TaxID=1353976 RepID=UPI0005A70C08|nr:hypothetical protein [Neochlamydia sp. S13]BBI16910.1 hypothetical protein NCS13_1_0715 [Neochlamydia sp. S13]
MNNIFPNYIVDREPMRYGGYQEDYQLKSKEIIREGIRKIKISPQDNNSLTALFFNLLEQFGTQRRKIAEAHETLEAAKFGLRRDIDGLNDWYHTILDGVYQDYNAKILGLLANHLQDMALETKSSQRNKKLAETCLNHNFSLEIKLLESEDYTALKWNRATSLEEFKHYFNESQISLLQINEEDLSINEIRERRQAMKKLKESNIELYIRTKMVSFFSMMNKQFPSPKLVSQDGQQYYEGHTKNFKSFFLLGTARLQVNKKLFASTQYFTWLYRDAENRPVERMLKCSTVILIHQDNLLINETLQEIASIFAKAVLVPQENLNELKNTMALLRYYLAHAMPFERGSAAIGEWIEGAVYGSHGLKVTYQKEKQVDLEALTSPLFSQFLNEYSDMICLTDAHEDLRE